MVASSVNDFKRQKALACAAFWSLDKIWYSQAIPLELFRSCLFVLPYDCETWIMIKNMSAKLNAFATSYYRIMLNTIGLEKGSKLRIYDLTDIILML